MEFISSYIARHHYPSGGVIGLFMFLIICNYYFPVDYYVQNT